MYGQLILLAVLILINAYFAAAEMAIVSANKNRIRTLANEGNKKAVILNKLIDEPNKFLSAIQVVITLAGFLTSAEAAISFSDDVGAWLEGFGIPYGEEIAVIIVTLVLSFFTLVFGELFPKRLAMLHVRPMSPDASFTPLMLGCWESVLYVSAAMPIPVLLGTLYSIIGISTLSAT